MRSDKLYVRMDIGDGNPLVLLHGMFADGSQWDDIAKLLSSDYRVIVVDLLGHGRSPRLKKATYSDVEHVQALRNTLVSLRAMKSVTVVGYSMGGAVALAYSSTYPDSVEQVYLISTPFYLKPEEMIPAQYSTSLLFTKATTSLFRSVEKLMGKQKLATQITAFGNKSKKFHAMIGADDNELDPETVSKNLDKLVREFNFVKHLKNLKVPLTFYVGKKDVFVIQGQLDALRQYKPDMEIQRLDIIKIDHMLVQNLPYEMARLIRKNKQDSLHVSFDEGKGEPMLLLHGIESSSDYWQPLLPTLLKGRRVIAIDLLGFGKSPRPLNIAYTLDDQRIWLTRTVESLKIKKFSIMAHSLGALVALEYASKNTGRIRNLILFSPVFVPKNGTGSHVLKRVHLINKLAEASTIYSRTAKALGQKRIAQYVPLVRSVKNGILRQDADNLMDALQEVPMTILFGEKDNLVDQDYLQSITRNLKNTRVVGLRHSGHNFPFFDPRTTIANLDDFQPVNKALNRTDQLPKTFLQQLAHLAAPILLVKSLFFICIGILLLTDLASWVVTIGLCFYVFKLGYTYIRGAFSLRNENLSYIGYIFLGVSGILLSYLLFKRPDLALKIASLVISGLVLLSGLCKLLVALVWTKRSSLRRRLIFTGSLLSILGFFALSGSIISIKLVVYGIAGIAILRGLQFGVYAVGSLILAYIRGYQTASA